MEGFRLTPMKMNAKLEAMKPTNSHMTSMLSSSCSEMPPLVLNR